MRQNMGLGLVQECELLVLFSGQRLGTRLLQAVQEEHQFPPSLHRQRYKAADDPQDVLLLRPVIHLEQLRPWHVGQHELHGGIHTGGIRRDADLAVSTHWLLLPLLEYAASVTSCESGVMTASLQILSP